jgi:hypothetical protein
MEKVTQHPEKLLRMLKYLVVLISFLILLKMYVGERQKKLEQIALVEASADTLRVWKNKNGENVAKISVLESMSAKTFLAFKTQDTTIRELQKLVKDNSKLFKNSKGSAGIINSQTDINASGATTVTQDEKESPIYTANLVNKWYTINSVATKDSTSVKLKTVHSLSFVIGSESQGLFKPRKTFVTAKDKNPFSNITDMRVYNVTETKKKFVIGPYIGGGANLIGNDVKLGWQVGAGITYKLIEF